MRDKTFARLLKAGINSIATCEGKTAAIVEDELGVELCLSGHAVQRYKAGHIPPDPDTIKILARAAVKRGFLNREWAERFLHVARYPNPERLLDQICPRGLDVSPLVRVYENLPAPTYSRFVMREEPYNTVIDGLSHRTPIVLVVSLGGMGKTSLVREIAAQCIQEDSDAPKFNGVVWISDKGREGTTSLSSVLDEIACTLDYPGLTQLPHEEKLREVEQLLRRKRVLLVIDNFETISDGALLPWLIRLPEPSKVVVTSREYHRGFRNCTFVVELGGLNDREAHEFIRQRLQVLRMESLVSDPSELAPLLEATGRNPKAIELALGYIKYDRRPLNTVLDEIWAAKGALFDDMFTRCWEKLDLEARNVLLGMHMFPYSASNKAVAATANVRGFAFDRSIERLTDLSLLDVQQKDLYSEPRYSLHSLVHAFAGSKLKEHPEFDHEARKRWVAWHRDLAAQIGFCWNDISKLELLDVEDEQETMRAVIEWTFQNEWYEDTIQISRDVRYYYYVRGLWSLEPSINLRRAEAARRQGRSLDELEALLYHMNIASKQGNINEVERHLPRAHEIVHELQVPLDMLVDYRHVTALYKLARKEYTQALELWKQNSELTDLPPHANNANLRWMAVCLYRQGVSEQRTELLFDARRLFTELLHDAEQLHFLRGAIAATVKLAAIDLEEGNLDDAQVKLDKVLSQATDIKDKRATSEVYQLYSKLYRLRGNVSEEVLALVEAIDRLERLGLYEELKEARARLAEIDY